MLHLVTLLSLFDSPVVSSCFKAQRNTSKFTNCIIPRINPFDPERTQFDWHPQPIKCTSWLDIVFIDYDGYLKMNQSAVKLSNITDVKCVYHLIRRLNDFKISLDKSKKLLTPIHIPTDFVLVNCTNANSTLVYKKILVNIHFRSVQNRRKLLPESKTDLSVLLFGVDSMSRLGAERRLQSTMKYIRSLPNSYIFEGYNKVEESTFVNLIPVLTGQLPFPRFVNISSWKVPLDPIPFIWNEFKSKGASILYAEDWVYSATFALQKGFANPVFDHYYRPFLLAINAVHKMNIDSSFCYGNTPKFNLQIEYLKRYFVAYKKIRKFALSWMNSIAHNQPNNLELVDKPFSEFFMWLNNNGYLEKNGVDFLRRPRPAA